MKTLKKCPDAASHQDLTPSPPEGPEMVLIYSTFIRKTKHSCEFTAIYLGKGGRAPRHPSPTTRQLEAGREETV